MLSRIPRGPVVLPVAAVLLSVSVLLAGPGDPDPFFGGGDGEVAFDLMMDFDLLVATLTAGGTTVLALQPTVTGGTEIWTVDVAGTTAGAIAYYADLEIFSLVCPATGSICFGSGRDVSTVGDPETALIAFDHVTGNADTSIVPGGAWSVDLAPNADESGASIVHVTLPGARGAGTRGAATDAVIAGGSAGAAGSVLTREFQSWLQNTLTIDGQPTKVVEVVARDGCLWAAGNSTTKRFVCKYTLTDSGPVVDSSFGTNGCYKSVAGDRTVRGLRVDEQGFVYLVETGPNSFDVDVFLLRVESDGSALDSSFGPNGDGRVTVDTEVDELTGFALVDGSSGTPPQMGVEVSDGAFTSVYHYRGDQRDGRYDNDGTVQTGVHNPVAGFLLGFGSLFERGALPPFSYVEVVGRDGNQVNAALKIVRYEAAFSSVLLFADSFETGTALRWSSSAGRSPE